MVAFGVSFQVIFSVLIFEENEKWYEIVFGTRVFKTIHKMSCSGCQEMLFIFLFLFLKLEKHVISTVLKLRWKRKTRIKTQTKICFRIDNKRSLLYCFFFFFQFSFFFRIIAHHPRHSFSSSPYYYLF